jgi:hypothetical protein
MLAFQNERFRTKFFTGLLVPVNVYSMRARATACSELMKTPGSPIGCNQEEREGTVVTLCWRADQLLRLVYLAPLQEATSL